MHHPAYSLLAAVANNPDEQELRTLFLNKYKHNPILGMIKYTEDCIRMFRDEQLSEERSRITC